MLTIFNERQHFWQWDVDQKLVVKDGVACEVHFRNPDGNVALTVETYQLDGKTVVNVPNILLQKTDRINAWIYICNGDNCTIHENFFNVLPRQKPADYVYTETEIKSYETLEKRVKNIEDGGGASGLFIIKDVGRINDNGVKVSHADKTVDEIRQAISGGKICMLLGKDGHVYSYYGDGEYKFPEGDTYSGIAFAAVPFYNENADVNGDTEYTFYSRIANIKEDGDIGYRGARGQTTIPKPMFLYNRNRFHSYNGGEQLTIPITDVAITQEENATTITVDSGNDHQSVTIPHGTGGTGGGLPAGEAPHQMLVTDADGAAKWEDKLCYTETLQMEVFPETELTYVEDANLFALTTPLTNQPVWGVNHTIVYNGTAYECFPETLEGYNCAFGNVGFLVDGTYDYDKPPFILVFPSPEDAGAEGLWAAFFGIEGEPTATVSVSVNGEHVKQIDEKYIPEIPEHFIVTVKDDDQTNSFVADRTYDELLAAYDAGKMLYCYYDNSRGFRQREDKWFPLTEYSDAGSSFSFASPSIFHGSFAFGFEISKKKGCRSLSNDFRSLTLESLTLNDDLGNGYSVRKSVIVPLTNTKTELIENRGYTADLSGEVAFTLSEPENVIYENRIRMLANVAADTTIDWGTTYYYGAAVPFVTEGTYEFLWEYNPLIGAWVAGATRIGQVVSE